jgi:U6 snRNA-associated Sm-like protein LSm4
LQIKYFRIADAILDQAAEEQEKQRAAMRSRGGSRGESGAALFAYHLF